MKDHKFDFKEDVLKRLWRVLLVILIIAVVLGLIGLLLFFLFSDTGKVLVKIKMYSTVALAIAIGIVAGVASIAWLISQGKSLWSQKKYFLSVLVFLAIVLVPLLIAIVILYIIGEDPNATLWHLIS